jgi:hypothetical protein
VLQVEPDELDVERFERLSARGRRKLASGDAGAASRLLSDAEALWRGRALADLAEEPFAQAAAVRLEEARIATL